MPAGGVGAYPDAGLGDGFELIVGNVDAGITNDEADDAILQFLLDVAPTTLGGGLFVIGEQVEEDRTDHFPTRDGGGTRAGGVGRGLPAGGSLPPLPLVPMIPYSEMEAIGWCF
jgi:hypothetical protein